MKLTTFRTLFLTIFILSTLLVPNSVMAQSSIPEIEMGLKSADVMVRREAAKSLLNYVSEPMRQGSIEHLNDKILPLITIALTDNDAEVRERGAVTAVLISQVLTEFRTFNKKPPVDIQSFPALKDALLKALVDSSPVVRENAIMALFGGFGLLPEAENVLVKQFSADPSPKVRAVMVEVLGQRPSPKAVGVLINALQDENDHVRGSAARALSEIKPPDVLPKLVGALKPGSPSVGTILNAISAYGAEAKVYLPELEEMRKKETDQQNKKRYDDLISKLQRH
jgi:HEAT repeat protein